MRIVVLMAGGFAFLVVTAPVVGAGSASAGSGQVLPSVHASGSAPAAAEADRAVGGAHTFAVRSVDAAIAAHITEACRRSPSFRALVADITARGGIVYVKSGRCPVIPGIRGCLLHVIHQFGDTRYLWVVVRSNEPVHELMSTIAHELQHAAEILARPEIRTNGDIARFYRSADGRDAGARPLHVGMGSYETPAAVLAGDHVRGELKKAHASDRIESGCAAPRRNAE